MPFTDTPLHGCFIFEPRIFNDARGYFFESYSSRVFSEKQISQCFVQDNQSYSCYGVIRGLHYQKGEHAQSKLIRVLQGRIMDAVVDLRVGSPSFGKSFAIELSSENKKQLFIPKGFAHGFSVLSETAEISYKCDQFYNKASEGGLLFSDPGLKIDWGIPQEKALVSEKDLELPLFSPSLTDFKFAS